MEKENFKKLTPDNKVKIEGYEEAFDFVFLNDDLRNVAISGQYGSGKSSVLATYKSKRKDRKFLHVSVAHFNQENVEGDINSGNGGSQSSILEWKILNQLVHQIDPENLTLSKFKTKKKYSFWNKRIAIATALFGMLILIGFYILNHNHLIKIGATLNAPILDFIVLYLSKPESLVLGTIIFCLLFLAGIYYILHLQRNNMLFKKIKVKDNEIEMFESDQDSYFDHYLNEVIYIFNNIEEDSIIFEDIDRFNDSGIFERLHEINRLINLQQENGKIVRFFYLIRDDVFVTKDRTKFFDFIIPIVPVTDSSNAQDILLRFFRDANMTEEIENRFLRDVSLYLDDMRIIKNIFNEYLIYRTRLGASEADNNINRTKLLGMVIYKNLFPRDFSNLQLNEGLVYMLFNQKDRLVSEEIKRLENKIGGYKEDIDLIKNEVATSQEELKVIYETLHKQRTYPYNNIEPSKMDEYNKRKNLIEQNVVLGELNIQILKVRDKINKLNLQPLKKVLNKINIESYFNDIEFINAIEVKNDFNDVKTNKYFDLLKYLVRNGYLDESYPDYMSYFYEESTSREDKKFLRSIADQNTLGWDYKLKDHQKVIENIDQLTIRQQEAQNFSLLEYLLSNDSLPEYKKLLSNFFDQIKEDSNYEFVNQFFNKKLALRTKITKYLTKEWNDFWNDVYINKRFDDEFIWAFSIQLLINMPHLSELEFNIDHNLSKYISNNNDYLNIHDLSNSDEITIINSIKELGVSFSSIGIANIDLLSKVYKSNLYELSQSNVNLMLNTFYGDDIEVQEEKNYSTVMSQESSQLAKYIASKKEEYLSNLLSQTSIEFCDSMEWYLDIINDENLSETIRIEYINRSQVKILDILDVVETKFWEILLKNNKLVFNENNLYEYYSQNKSDEQTFAEFINSNEEKLNMNTLEDKEDYSEFFGFVVSNNFIDNKKYHQIVNSFLRLYTQFEFEGVIKEKMDILIDSYIVKMTEFNLNSIRKNYSISLNGFILKFFDEYIDILVKTGSLVIQDELEQLLLLDLDITQVNNILELSKKDISVIDKGFNEKVISLILDKLYDTGDLPHLFSKYEDYGNDVKARINILAMNHISVLIENLEHTSKELILNLLNNSFDEANRETGLNLFVESIPYLDYQNITQLFEVFNLTEFIGFFDFEKRKRLVIEANKFNLSILESLKEAGLIYDFNLSYADEWYTVKRKKL